LEGTLYFKEQLKYPLILVFAFGGGVLAKGNE
jgi:hypothetical protein